MILSYFVTWPIICPSYDNVLRKVGKSKLTSIQKLYTHDYFKDDFRVNHFQRREATGLKKKVIVKMHVPTTPLDIQVFNNLVQFHYCFVIFFAL
jgi:hypothetical protein